MPGFFFLGVVAVVNQSRIGYKLVYSWLLIGVQQLANWRNGNLAWRQAMLCSAFDAKNARIYKKKSIKEATIKHGVYAGGGNIVICILCGNTNAPNG